MDKHKPQELEQLRFYHECAADWRAQAHRARLSKTRETCLEFAALWQGLATQAEKSLTALNVSPSEERQLVDAAE